MSGSPIQRSAPRRALSQTVHRHLWRNLATFALIVVCVLGASSVTGTSLIDAFENADQAADFFSNLLHPDWPYFAKLWIPLLQTIRMSVVGTVLGLVFAIPFAFLCTRIVTSNRALTAASRIIMDIVRTIPNLLLAALIVAFVGIGQVSGILTIAIFTFGVVGQLVYQTIDTVDPGPLEAAHSVGANRTQTAVWAVAPQVRDDIASYALYAFEINIRASVVLGYVGAGGLGVLLNSSLSLQRYDRVSLVILTVLVLVVAVDWLSGSIRRRLR
ncbi:MULTISPECIES: phosphonate ABC transporter, permease protein PhnE [Bifidobacterium]|jgi:phosphonate transport system permease protein|uniref:Phosphonate ABC transporter, permease protein PhnE n=1 Tax=Bifidobacterium tibiigranuli TaxID=2172043 RepID=A0A5N6S6R9_9BIFI|nr:phosphonate ABC transporter, permease protein PhnE [Bifidobacterium tibiigranuli]KAE8129153.1 phosphonate ABC transporter, permease protein PhnE [Bifidobacterium tibiigranuli]KAE8129391.1 phosphonate ABC transporter, permease protein PhnE [Bifidobacterium tibiigranuli]MCH3975359.1 phosphonate ABC transporter, permease protein PhnE [Bifidobacterium tibiigranuli]MCH4189938.1 phosphonate ABC transporter, permease protein PhnE [Bifidobacterium tibiigranuli]MCH4203558.1 phosphonate ABC transport